MTSIRRIINIALRAFRRVPFLYSLGQWIYLNTFERFSKSKRFIRKQYFQRLASLSKTIQNYGLRAGLIAEYGNYYLRMPEDIFLLYNYSDPNYVFGDGQSLDLVQNVEKDPIRDLIRLSMLDKKYYFDVGANNGYYYALQIARSYPEANIFAFDPNPKILEHLRKNVNINKISNIRIVAETLSDYEGTAALAFDLGASSFINPQDKLAFSTVEVPCRTLDAFIRSEKVAGLDVIKLDVEGAELQFLKGAKSSISNFLPVMVMELKENFLKRSGASQKEVMVFLWDLGYKIYEIKGSGDIYCLPDKNEKLLAAIEKEPYAGTIKLLQSRDKNK